ncbi:hypothetical protein PRUPE_4G264800 [Prunus persica]|uniref:Leucine-rich repeat-containing N-terminal plant-type domain-containing protein n=1 Tax=Prunus persica TaxID=3760 RepID=M5X153_PRUPE|nr:hypothetical protein PRUPE_4G264800 [Prunus persica]
MPKSSSLDLSNNKLPGFLCGIKASNLTLLDLTGNHVSGELPDCWAHLENLVYLGLCGNGFFGKIPTTLGNLYSLETLKLKNNRFVGEFPSSLMNCKHLKVFDVAELSGLIPGWLGFELRKLVFLILRSNLFYGRIPLQLCNLTHVQILDLSINNISGTIPKCLNNLTALVDKGHSILTITHHYASDFGNGIFLESYDDAATLIWKGIMSEYKSTLGLVKSFHLSSNQLTGEIPKEIIHLGGLVSLNLSRNHLTGQINPDIGKLELLQSLDLSRNQIDGRIPTSLFQIYSLGDLDLSNNNIGVSTPKL